MREIVIGAAQMGGIRKAETRAEVVARMLALLDEARRAGCDLVVYPELCLTTFFPRWYTEDPAKIESWFEREMPGPDTAPLFDSAAEAGIAVSLGLAELTPEGRRFNTQIMTDRAQPIVGSYRKVHLPGHGAYDPERSFQHLEKCYFEPGDLGFPVFRNLDAWMGMLICNDRRWPEAYREMGPQGVELACLGYNTPSANSRNAGESAELRRFHSELSVQAGAYQNSCWVVSVAKRGTEDGHHMIAGSVIVDPNGQIVARPASEGDEFVVHACDMDAPAFGKASVFDFKRHRRIEHYGRITGQTGVIYPDGTEG